MPPRAAEASAAKCHVGPGAEAAYMQCLDARPDESALHARASTGHGAAVAISAPIFIVMNAGSGEHGGEDVRLVIQETLSGGGRSFSLHEVDEPARLKAVAAEVVERAREQGG